MNAMSRITLTMSLSALVLALGLAASPAAADDSPNTDKADTPTRLSSGHTSQAKPKVKTLIFGEGSDVEGGVVGPDGDSVSVAGPLVHSNLIRVRQHFIPEIFKSAENL